MRPPAVPPRRKALMVSAVAVLAALFGGAMLCAAILVPAPAAALPLLGLVCIGLPMLAAWELARTHTAIGGLASALRSRRRRSRDEQALRELRRALERLPETSHPLE